MLVCRGELPLPPGEGRVRGSKMRFFYFISKVSLPRRYLNRVLAPEGELLSFASPRQLLLHCSTSCILAVEKKVTKEKATRLPLASYAPRFCRGSAEGAPAPLLTCGIPAAPLTGYSRQKLRCSARHTGQKPSVRNALDRVPGHLKLNSG
jgi:hypothetical protein